MNRKLRWTLAAVLTSFLAVSLPITTAAQDTPPPRDHGGEGDGQGEGDHDGGGREHHFGFPLVPSAGAPAGAGGWAAIFTDPATSLSTLKIVTRGLAAGTYTVNVTGKDSSVTSFGTFDVASPVAGSDDDGAITLASLAFPTVPPSTTPFDPANIATVEIDDSSTPPVPQLSGTYVAPTGNPGGRDHCHQEFVLAATATAPAGAAGEAGIEVEDDSATPSATLHLKTENLPVGTYTVNVTSLSTGTVTTLGTFDVVANADGSTPLDERNRLDFPAGYNVQDIASVQVADSTGANVLTGDGTVKGIQVEGSEQLHEEIRLVAAPGAPTGAGGEAKIKACNKEGASTATLRLEVEGLAAATYTVQVTSIADGTATVLGTFDVGSATSASGGEVEFGTEVGLPFPAGFNPLDVATVVITDSTNTPVLTGDFSALSTVKTTAFTAKVRVTPGPVAPKAKGTVTLGATVTRHVVHQTFALTAKGAPASTVLTLTINGAAVGTLKSSRAGNVVVSKAPKGVNTHKIHSVVLTNASGGEVLSAHF